MSIANDDVDIYSRWLFETQALDVNMWDILKNCFALLALTEYVQQLVYIEQEKVEGVFVNGPNVGSEYENFTLVMLGIDNLVDTFNLTLSGSNQQKRSEKGSIDRISIASQD
ncbi:hypothetical protein EDC96DRAFT_525207, partial [Choanephora cucurbitarum]